MPRPTLFLLLLIVTALASACESLKSIHPLLPNKEYERLLVGRLDADYVGNERCLSACHAHDRKRLDLEASTMGAQMPTDAGLPVVDCESCHGPGSLAIEGITAEKVIADRAVGVETACHHDALIEPETLPAGARSTMCLNCHAGNATFNLHDWNASAHAMADVTCSHCHPIHAGPDLIVRRDDTFTMCLGCHKKTAAELQLPSHHPVLENKITCTDCHDPHGAASDGMLRAGSQRETCGRCHVDREGPYAFEHADLLDECSECHQPHGAIANNLLNATEPILCLRCHAGHRVSGMAGASSAEAKGAFFTRCTDCHATVHGTDVPSASGRGTFVQ